MKIIILECDDKLKEKAVLEAKARERSLASYIRFLIKKDLNGKSKNRYRDD